MMNIDCSFAVSSRIRFARNIADFPFCGKMTEAQRIQLRDIVRDAFFSANSVMSKNYEFIDIDALPRTRQLALVERHLISPEFAQGQKGRGLIVSKDRNLSIMINEEDHLRIQVLTIGFDLLGAYRQAKDIEALLAQQLKFSYSDKWGYLTACHTNIGTGMRASIMLHLPAITATGAIKQLINETGRLGVTVRGVFGEGSTAQGELYQLSNMFTLGVTDTEILTRMQEVISSVMEQEKKLLQNWHKTQGIALEDKVFRAYATLRAARLISTAEFEKLYSFTRLGIALKLIDFDPRILDKLLENCRPACLVENNDTQLSPEGRDEKRAALCRQALQ